MSQEQPTVEPDPTVVVVGLDPVAPSVRDADHLAEHLGEALEGQDVVVSTHLVPAPGGASARVALAVRWLSAAPRDGELDGVVRALCTTLLPETGAQSADEIGASAGGRLSGYPVLARSAQAAARDAAEGRDGRAVVFPGRSALGGTLPVADVVGRSAIVDVIGIAGTPVSPETLVDTRDHVRPVWREGRLVLPVQPAGTGVAVYENPHPTPCCADHA